MKRTTERITIWKIACKVIFLHIKGVIIYSFLEYGILNKSSSEGGSVAKAKAARVSIIKLTHSIWTGVKGDYLMKTAPKKAMNIATTLTVNWNCKNFLMQSKMFLPYFAAVTILPKLSSSKMIPAAYLAISTPAMPIANPISAFLRAGASFPPSPVIATTCPSSFRPVASKYLSSGDDLAKTLSYLATCLNT